MTVLRILRAGPLSSVQDDGRFGARRHGVSASGPMDRAAFARAGYWIGAAGPAGIEFTTGIAFEIDGEPLGIGADGGDFSISRNGIATSWPARFMARKGDRIEIAPGAWGNYGYLRFDREMALPPVMGSRATNHVVGLGGLDGRSLSGGDSIAFGEAVSPRNVATHPRAAARSDIPIRIVWGLHAELFPRTLRNRFTKADFTVSPRIDRMGARLLDSAGIFSQPLALALVSDAIVPGDIQILGDGTPIVLLRDHQPTGGYPRIATVITADLDRFVQLRPGTTIRFEPVTLASAHALLKEARP